MFGLWSPKSVIKSGQSASAIIYQQPPPPVKIGVVWSSRWTTKFDVRSSVKIGRMWEIVCAPRAGTFDPACFQKERFWEIDCQSSRHYHLKDEIYIADSWAEVDRNYAITYRFRGFTEKWESEVDEYGVNLPVEKPPEINPFEERRRKTQNVKLMKRNLNLLLDEDI